MYLLLLYLICYIYYTTNIIRIVMCYGSNLKGVSSASPSGLVTEAD